jgi:uncharacterized protein YdeI (YjbR/CyaY-like superfamily)
MADLALVDVADRAAWRSWLAANHARSPGIWLVLRKKAAGASDLDYPAVVEEALCFGWVDSRPNKLDAARYKLMVTPRKPGSGWSKLNKTRVAKLTAAGRMATAGLAAVAAAKRDKSWNALDQAESLTVPPDFARALAAKPAAAKYFAAFPPGSRKIILTWITGAKRPETRTARIAETVKLAAKNLRANHWRQ